MTTFYEIRPARPNDADAISAMMHASYGELLKPDYNPRILTKALPRISTARPELLASGTYYVAERLGTGEILGSGGWTDISPTRGLGAAGEGHMRHLAVHPDVLQQGIGRALAEVSLASARALGVTCLRCMSTLTAEPFYQAMGFGRLQNIELTLEPGLFFPTVEMRKDIA